MLFRYSPSGMRDLRQLARMSHPKRTEVEMHSSVQITLHAACALFHLIFLCLLHTDTPEVKTHV